MSAATGIVDCTSLTFGLLRTSADPCQLRGFLVSLTSSVSPGLSLSLSDKTAAELSLGRSLALSACARDLATGWRDFSRGL